MLSELNNNTPEEKELLLKAPVLISILAALSNDSKITVTEKEAAERLAHIRTYTADPLLRDYYKEVDKVFEDHFNSIVRSLPDDSHQQREHLKEQLEKLRTILPKLKKTTAEKLVRSLKGFLLHVFKSNTNAFSYLLISGVMNEIERTVQNAVKI